ncbi:corrinoid protein [Methermicoccus shengliensis]|uniref:Cobalamin-binding protein n=1 Tax=Methermicoccus shengliensis TaxID=660064 RepID=A0A832RY32_9EURY|nr:corrinoid protein [Methermicoccus shengliensis]KUK04938.1 MAG: Coenzyme B12-binding:Cobalamin-dependent methionine synthase, B12-binding [Euryarchaeota archaeon 55_53]KUK30903.1 MAG: Coenzyme B12-binding:Cobalamin-dependent methionine synthase, B12-binding [Methanosarcinales archeaon 56_1174]MDI3487636.1 hypothetical protein [Methanosarcinales archaeon]MDN5294969.1 hypothetical protein [Methanosarcinales archaeon]HIH69974.1 cobalamin-binding protein [Methermicoccus shengliensis]
MGSRLDILEELKESIVTYDARKAVESAQRALQNGVDPKVAISEGLSAGMKVVGDMYEQGEMYLPEVLAASDAMYAALDVLLPHLKTEGLSTKETKRVVIGTVEGDVHTIGKKIVGTMLKVAGYDVTDLGGDVPLEKFIETAESQRAHVIAMSTLMTTTMENMRDVIKMLEERGLRGKYRVAIGGAPITEEFKEQIGADIYAPSAEEAVRVFNRVFEREREVERDA